MSGKACSAHGGDCRGCLVSRKAYSAHGGTGTQEYREYGSTEAREYGSTEARAYRSIGEAGAKLEKTGALGIPGIFVNLCPFETFGYGTV